METELARFCSVTMLLLEWPLSAVGGTLVAVLLSSEGVVVEVLGSEESVGCGTEVDGAGGEVAPAGLYA